MAFSEEEIFDYVEKNLPKKKLEEMKKIIDANSELKEKVSNIEKGMAISIELARHEEERSELNFDGIMEEAEKKIKLMNKNEKKNNVISFIKKKLSFEFKTSQFAAVAASFVIAYFTASTYPIHTFFNENAIIEKQYAWVSEQDRFKSSDNTINSRASIWTIKDLGLSLKFQAYTPEGKLIPIQMNDEINIDNTLILNIRSELNNAEVKLDGMKTIKISKGEEIEPIPFNHQILGNHTILIYILDEIIIFPYKVIEN